MENIITVKAEARSGLGKNIAKKIRKEGNVPAIIYGSNIESMPVTITLNDVKKILKSEMGENTILKIEKDKDSVDAMLKQVQWDYLSDHIIHVDFMRIDLNKPVRVDVPITIQGEPIGVKTEDGLFDFMKREISVSCLPTQIPREIVVVVDELHIGQSIKVSDLKLQEGVSLLSDPNSTICGVSTKGAEEAEAEKPVVEGAEAVPAAEGAAPAAAADKAEKTDKGGKAEKPEKGEKKEG